MRSRREARLRPEYAARYPYLSPDRWEPAAVMADRVVAHTLSRPNGRFITGESWTKVGPGEWHIKVLRPEPLPT